MFAKPKQNKSILREWVEAIVVALAVVFVIKTYIFGLYRVPSGSAEPTLLIGDYVWGNKLAYRFGAKPQRGEEIIFDNPEVKFDKSSTVKYLWQKYVGFPVPIFGLPAGPDNVTKRVIAIPGDTIEGRVEDGKTAIYLNGKKLDEPYVNPYPLVHLMRKTGFLNPRGLGSLPLLNFFAAQVKVVPYTYDPEKSLADQPYYNMTSEDIFPHPRTGNRWLLHSGTPIKRGSREYDVFGPMTVPPGKYWMMGDSRLNSGDSRFWHFLDEERITGRAGFIIASLDTEESFWLFELIKHPFTFWTQRIRWNRFFKGIGNDNRLKK